MQWDPDADIIIFDEVHKYSKWKSHIKGIRDTRQNNEKIIITGSARLDIFRRGGDSLLGRYHYYRLHPFSLAEIHKSEYREPDFPDKPFTLSFDKKGDQLEELFNLGGFPEPFLTGNRKNHRRWLNERFERIFREDIRDLENINSFSKIELLGHLIIERVGSPLSLSSLITDVEVSIPTIKSWLELLCRNYYLFKVPPYHRRMERALKKEAKYYLWDWSEIKDDGIRFENMIASHLLKFAHLYHDAFGINTGLFFLRDREKREVDFLLTWENEPWIIVEVKLTKPDKLTSLHYFSKKLSIEQRFVVTRSEKADYVDKTKGIRIIPAARFLMALV